MGQACCNEKDLMEKDKQTLDFAHSKSKFPPKQAQERDTSYVEGQDSPIGIEDPNEDEPMELIVMASPTNRSLPKYQEYKEMSKSQAAGIPTTVTSDRNKLQPTQSNMQEQPPTQAATPPKLILDLSSPKQSPAPQRAATPQAGIRSPNSLQTGEFSQSLPPEAHPKFPTLNKVILTQQSFDVATYERDRYREFLPLDDELLHDTATGVKDLLNVEGKFVFRLDNYCGQHHPVHQVEFAGGAIIYYGQGTRSESGSFIKEGKGHLVTRTSLFSGYFAGDRTFGPGVFITQDETASYLFGFWVQDILNGNGLLVYDTGYKYFGNFLNGLQHGKGREIWPDESTYEGEYKAGSKDGHGECNWPGIAKYVGEFKEGNFHGHGQFFWANGNNYDGMWKNNQISGFGVFTWADGMKYQGNYVSGKREGIGRITWPGQMLWEGQWKQGRRILSCGRYGNLEGDCMPRHKSPDIRARELKRNNHG